MGVAGTLPELSEWTFLSACSRKFHQGVQFTNITDSLQTVVLDCIPFHNFWE